jgi:trehalose synthase
MEQKLQSYDYEPDYEQVWPALRGHRYAWLDDYVSLIGEQAVERIARKVESLSGLEVQFINSTKQGGGVAEILRSLVPLMNGIGIRAHWTSIVGPPSFYDVTKNIHNMLQGQDGALSVEEKSLFEETVAANAPIIDLKSDVVVVHDPQPLPLIRYRHGRRRWIWRCHLDLSMPNMHMRDYLLPMVEGYDASIYTLPEYALPVKLPTHVIMPAIDPFTIKNRMQNEQDARTRLKQYGIPDDRPIVTQISRYDSWKDPRGVIEACRIARREVDFTLVLLGNFASDDPEGMRNYEQLLELRDERTLILVDGDDQLLVNALQSRAAIVLQKSIREGFGLTVTESMWKGKPVIAGRVGGIVRQIEDGVNGYLISSIDEAAARIVQILRDPALGRRLGRNARRTVQENFLLTRLLEQYLDLLRAA